MLILGIKLFGSEQPVYILADAGIGPLNDSNPAAPTVDEKKDSIKMVIALSFMTLDVFSDRAFGGNPLAVMVDGRWVDLASCQTRLFERNGDLRAGKARSAIDH